MSPEGENEDKIENLQKKANYYYMKAETVWETMLNKSEKLNDIETLDLCDEFFIYLNKN